MTGSDNDRFYSTQEAADYLRLHPKTLCRKSLSGELHHERIGRQLRFKRAWLDEFAMAWRQGRATSSHEHHDLQAV